MSLELVIETLVSCGLQRTDAEVYTFLAKNGPHSRNAIANILNLTKQQVYLALKNLKEKSIVKSTSKLPTLFYAEPIENILTLFMEIRKKEIQKLILKKQEPLSTWKKMRIKVYN